MSYYQLEKGDSENYRSELKKKTAERTDSVRLYPSLARPKESYKNRIRSS